MSDAKRSAPGQGGAWSSGWQASDSPLTVPAATDFPYPLGVEATVSAARGDDFAAVLDAIGHQPGDAVVVCYKPHGGTFHVEWTTAEKAPEVAATHAADSDVWFSVNGLPHKGTGRGTAADVSRWAALYADLDVKVAGLPDLTTCWAVVYVLSGMLGSRPVAVIESGHGLQPLWALDPDDAATHLTDANRGNAEALLRRFGRLVALVASNHGGSVDAVFDLARVLRVPGTVNRKAAPVDTAVRLDTGHPLTVADVEDALLTFGTAADQDGDYRGEVDTYSGPAFAALPADEQQRLQGWTDSAVAGIERLLRETAAWSEGHTDDRGRGWEKVQSDAAYRLGSLARATWCPLTRGEAREALVRAAPTCSTWTHRDVEAKWRSQRDRGAPAPDPVAGVNQSPASGAQQQLGADEHHEKRRVVLTNAASIKVKRVRWLWDGRIALGTLALLAGPEGLGKSTLAYWLAARLTRGDLPGESLGTPRSVLVCAAEDSWEHTIVPRLMAADADLARVYRVEMLGADNIHLGLSLPRDLAAAEDAAREIDAALLLLDPLMSRLGSNLDTHRDGDVRQALEPLVAMADKTGMAVLGLIHHNKSGSTNPLDLVMASKAFTAVARSVHSVIRDPDDEGRLLFGTAKNNLGRLDLPTLTFTIAGYGFPTEDGDVGSTSRVVWGEDAAGTIAEAIRRSGESPEDREDRHAATAWLHDWLTRLGGVDDSANIKKAGHADGHSARSLRTACDKLRVTYSREGFGKDGKTYWSLPGTQPSEQATTVMLPPDTTGARSRVAPPRGDTPNDITDTTDTTGGGKPPGQPSRVSRATPQGDVSPLSDTTAEPCPDCSCPLSGPPARGCSCRDEHQEVA